MLRHSNLWQRFLTTFALSDSRAAEASLFRARPSHGATKDEAIIATISARIHDKLGQLEIGVTSAQSLVQLSGRVDTPQIRARAGRIAGDTCGVRSVRNSLIVRLAKAEHPICTQNVS
ncbi:MAG: BON domain-containing protein [Alphaproteobacteria bacterium]|nr:BON domain-containing protein [Alphaproteobacteria bacterium]MBF0355276.1 BON domain-containing protein [Alphaproteobacteria bacterium]